MIVAGTAAIIAGAAWLTWALLNIVTSGGLDSGAGVGFRMTKLGQLLTVLWNLLLIPSVIVFWNQLRSQNPNLILIYSVCGILSQVFWAIGAAARVNSPMLEVTYVLLSGIW